jgi:hypothetical protein
LLEKVLYVKEEQDTHSSGVVVNLKRGVKQELVLP